MQPAPRDPTAKWVPPDPQVLQARLALRAQQDLPVLRVQQDPRVQRAQRDLPELPVPQAPTGKWVQPAPQVPQVR